VAKNKRYFSNTCIAATPHSFYIMRISGILGLAKTPDRPERRCDICACQDFSADMFQKKVMQGRWLRSSVNSRNAAFLLYMPNGECVALLKRHSVTNV
jgi:hypothetical protein